MTALLLMLACLPFMILYPCNLTLYNVCCLNSIAEKLMFSWAFSCLKSWGCSHLILHHRGVAIHQVLQSTPVDLCVRSLHLLLHRANLSRNVCGRVQIFDKEKNVSHQLSNGSYIWQNHNTNEGRACDTLRTLILRSVVFAAGGGKWLHRYGNWKCLGIHF